MPVQEDPDFTPVDPWQITGYLIAGVAVYGFLGWLADRWLGTEFLVAVGILLGTVFAMYLVWRRLNPAERDPAEQDPAGQHPDSTP